MKQLYLKDSIRIFIIKHKCLLLYYTLLRYTDKIFEVNNVFIEYCEKISKKLPESDWYRVRSLHIECLNEPIFKSLEYPSGTLFYIELCYVYIGDSMSKNIIRFCFDYNGLYSGECFINASSNFIMWYQDNKDKVISMFCTNKEIN